MSFETQVPGKWILAGEHSVLRGSPALVFPLYSRSLQLQYDLGKSPETLKVDLAGDHGEELQLLFWGVVEKACQIKGISRGDLKGQLHLKSSIPVGAGLGASAALSVAIAKWFNHLELIAESEMYEFARTLENLFHGESSGVDIAVALSGKPLKFVRNGERQIFEPKWTPKWYVSYSGKRGVTVECVNKVKALLETQPQLGQNIDADMKKAVQLAEEALHLDEAAGMPHLIKAIELAASCFERWGLNEGQPDLHMKWLKNQGALAVKPTGSGNGGYVLSLWQTTPNIADLVKGT